MNGNALSRFMKVLLALALFLLGPLSTNAQSAANVQVPSSPDADAQVRIAHYAPFETSDPQKLVDVRVNGAEALTDLPFGGVVYVNLPPGDHSIEILAAGTSTVLISGTVSLSADTSYTLVAAGDGTNQPLELHLMVNETTPVADKAKFRVTHMAPFASTGTTVEICVRGEATPLTTLDYKETTDPYLQLDPGFYDFYIAAAGSSCTHVLYAVDTIYFGAGTITDAFAVGGANGVPIAAATTTRITFASKVFVPQVAAQETR